MPNGPAQRTKRSLLLCHRRSLQHVAALSLKKKSGSEIVRWACDNKRVDLMIGAPSEMLG
jgi:hypothetical protein